MSGSDNWIKLYRWWQEHLKSHSNDYLIDSQPSLISTKSSQIIQIKKRSSYIGLENSQLNHNDFRHVRDSIRGKNPLTTRIISTQITAKKRHQFRKSTTCDISSDDIRSPDNKYLPTMNKKRSSGTRRLSLVKFELSSNDSNRTKEEQQKYPNSTLFKKIFCRQYSPKTRPYPIGYADDNISFPLSLNDNSRRMSNTFNSKQQTLRQIDEIMTPVNLDSYLSKRRNTTGSISINKRIDLKNLSNINHNQKLSNENIFQAVEDSDFLLIKQLINSNENLINSYNEYNWCPLDIAIMLNNIPMIRLLLHYDANESSKIQPEEIRYKNVCQQLIELFGQNLDDVQTRRLSPSCDKQKRHHQNKSQQQEQLNQQRSLTLSQMKDNYEQAGVPDAPTNVRLMVTGSDNITVTFDEPLRSNGAMVTKYRIEWSSDESFIDSCSDIIKNCFLREYIIRNLSVGEKCYVRVSAGNLKGFGENLLANPSYCIPSNWREFSKTSRTNICDLRFEDILQKIWTEKDGINGNESPETTNAKNRRRSYGNLRKNLRQLFQQYPRLARSMKRGLYLVSIMLNGDRILVTNEDVLPMVEVDENYGHNLLADFQWFMKLTFVWDDLKALRPDLERCASVTSFYLRIKLVQAAIELQTLEEINNLGRLHHTFIRDQDGNTAFILINDLSTEIRLNLCPPNLKWIPICKYLELMRDSPSNTNNSCFQQITDNLKFMIEFYHASMCRLDSGLYVAYLKIQNSVDSIRVMVNKTMPGSLPCTKIRSISNVSREEWEWLHKHNEEDQIEENLELFKNQFHSAAKELFVMLDLPETHFSNSRIYDSQVVEIREDLSLIILMSTADEVNHLSTSSSNSLSSFIYLPVYIFEVLQHLSNNYRFICQYSRVSICLDFELIYAQQSQREAFSIIELDESRYRLKHLLSCQQDLDDIWRLSRWLVHVINCAKDKTYSGISLKSFQTSSRRQTSSIEKSDSGFIDLEENIIELIFYLSLLTTNTYIPLKIRLNKITTLNQILEIILNEHQDTFHLNKSLLNFIWIPTNGREYFLEEHLTAYDLQKRLQRFGGQIHLRSKNLSFLHSIESQMNCSVDI